MAALAQSELGGAEIGVLTVLGLLYLGFLVLLIASLWRIFTKAGEDGWKSIIPIYNTVVILQIVGRPVWWIVLLLIPFVNFVIAIVLAVDLAKSFGKGGGFAAGLIFLGFIFLPILAFGDAAYRGPAGPEPRPGWSGPEMPPPGYGAQPQGYGAPAAAYGAPPPSDAPPPSQTWDPGGAPSSPPQSGSGWSTGPPPPSVQPPPPAQGQPAPPPGWEGPSRRNPPPADERDYPPPPVG